MVLVVSYAAAADADPTCVDTDGDTVCDGMDVCAGSDDRIDTDGDQIPDGCDCDQVGASCAADATCTESSDGATCDCNLGFSGDGMTCTPIDCGALDAPANGAVDAPSTAFGATATYSCNLGYLLDGAATRTCEEAGWSGAEPSCTILDCGALGAPANGGVSAPVTTFESRATYSCDMGYQLFGSDQALCGPDGDWLGAPPFCGSALDCACGGAFFEGERVRTTVVNASGANSLPLGTPGTAIAGSTGSPPFLIEFDGWFNGHNGNCGSASCGTCTAQGTSRRYIQCNEFETLRLDCMCGGTFSEGDRVIALVDNPAGASNLPRGSLGTVLAGTTSSPPLLIEWDGWPNGHNGNCGVSSCGTCVNAGNSRRYVQCNEVGLAP